MTKRNKRQAASALKEIKRCGAQGIFNFTGPKSCNIEYGQWLALQLVKLEMGTG